MGNGKDSSIRYKLKTVRRESLRVKGPSIITMLNLRNCVAPEKPAADLFVSTDNTGLGLEQKTCLK